MSVNEILIDENGVGILIDWEPAIFHDDNSDSNVLRET